MAESTPEWLRNRGCRLEHAASGRSWLVYLGNEPQYRLTPIPVGGKFGCEVVQTINGRHLERNNTYPTQEEAVRGGLEDLRKALGW